LIDLARESGERQAVPDGPLQKTRRKNAEVRMSKILEILKPYGRPSSKEEAVLDAILERVGRGSLSPEDAIDALIERLNWPLERAAAEVDGYLE
jgi:hypothetical protein